MKETIIPFDNSKRGKLILFAVLLFIASSLFAYYMVFQAQKIQVTSAILMLLCAVAGICMVVAGLKSVASKDKTGLILNADGVIFKGTPVARKIGLIRWADIQSLAVGKVYNSSFIFLKLKNPDIYLQDISGQVRQNIITMGVGITNDQLSIDFKELKGLIEQYHSQFR